MMQHFISVYIVSVCIYTLSFSPIPVMKQFDLARHNKLWTIVSKFRYIKHTSIDWLIYKLPFGNWQLPFFLARAHKTSIHHNKYKKLNYIIYIHTFTHNTIYNKINYKDNQSTWKQKWMSFIAAVVKLSLIDSAFHHCEAL